MAKRESFLQSLGSAIFWNTSNRISSLLKHVIVAALIGLSSQLDVFYMTIAILGILVFSWAKMIDVIAVPRMVELHQKENRSEFTRVSSGLFSLCVIFSLFLAVCMFAFNGIFAHIAFGFDAERQKLLADALLWMLPVALVYIPFRFVGSIFRTIRRFSVFYQAEFIIGLVALILIMVYKTHESVLLWSYSTGVVCAFVYIFWKSRGIFNPIGNPFSKEVRQIIKAAPSLLILQGSEYLFVLSDRIFISFLSKGSLGALAYGRMLAFLVSNLVSFQGSFITVFAEQNTSFDKKNNLYNDITSLSIFMAIPVSVFLLGFGETIIGFILERGVFTRNDTELVYVALCGFAWALLPFLAIVPLEQIFQVQSRIDLLVRRRIAGLCINGVLNAVFLFGLKWGVGGIALATSISHWFVFLLALYSAGEIGLRLEWGKRLLWCGWMIGVSLAGAVGLKVTTQSIDWSWFIVIDFVAYCTIIIIGSAFFFGKEGQLVRDTLKRIVLGRRSPT